MDIQYDSLSPEQLGTSPPSVIITTQAEVDSIVEAAGENTIAVIFDTDLERYYPAVAKARILKSIRDSHTSRHYDDKLTIGVDPGSRIGISVIYLEEEIDSSVETSPADASQQICALLGGIESTRKVVRIGDGNMRMARSIARGVKERFGEDVSVEIVDEHGTSSPQNIEANRRGARDRSSAKNIAFRQGRLFKED